MRRLILRNFQSPGDVVMLTAAVRDLHHAYPGRFVTDARTTAQGLWFHNPHISELDESADNVKTLDMHYPAVHFSNQRPYHFIHGFVQYLEERLDLRIPITEFRGDLYLSGDERRADSPVAEHGHDGDYWIVVAGGKYDYTAKWWNPQSYQQVVDHFRGRIQFVQCGEAGHWHPRLEGVVDLVGKTNTRQLLRVIYRARGVLCPVTLAMHLAAAVPAAPDRAAPRPCVVVAGGREPPHWEAYPTHQYISTVGMLPCCREGGCWRSRCQTVGDGDTKDTNRLCERPIQIAPDLRIPECMQMIRPADVIRRIELYHDGDVVEKVVSV